MPRIHLTLHVSMALLPLRMRLGQALNCSSYKQIQNYLTPFIYIQFLGGGQELHYSSLYEGDNKLSHIKMVIGEIRKGSMMEIPYFTQL